MSSRQKAACATAGLACAFGGIWSIDAHVAALSGTPYTTLWMRIVSLCVYLVACAIAIREPSIFDGNGETARKRAARLIACSTACLFISLAGSLGFIYGAKGALALACGFAMKLFGAPLTIALVCCYSRIKKADSTKASLIGISGAFVAQSILSSINVQQLWHPLIGICAGFALCAVAIICIAALLCTEAPEAAHAPSGTQLTKSQPNESRNQLPFRNVFTGPFLAILVSTSFMLGFFALGATNQRRFKRVAFYRHRPCRILRPFDSDRCAREPFKPSERRSRMRRGSLPRGSAHRLYRSRLPNGFSKLGHHRFRSGSMGNGGERRTPKPKNACGSRVCTPVRCVRSSPGRINRSKHARPFQCRRERNAGRLARRHLRIFHGRAVLGTRFDGSICPNRKGLNRTRNRQSGCRARRNCNAYWHRKRYMQPQRKRSQSRALGPYACRTPPEAFCAHQSTNEYNVAYGIRCHMRRSHGVRTRSYRAHMPTYPARNRSV